MQLSAKAELIDVPEAKSAIPSLKNYRPDIDGLRAIAVTSVVAYHAGVHVFSGGYVGVDMFFVISGYLIGAHVYKEIRHGEFSIAGFYQRRAKRILPALFVVLLFCYAVSLVLLDQNELKQFGQYAVATVASASNILAWLRSNYFAPGADQNPLLMTWSLGVEEQFYVIFPLLMLLFGRMGRSKLFGMTVAVVVLSLGLSIYLLRINPTATFYLLPTRAWELAVGVLLAVYETDRPAAELYGRGRLANLSSVAGMALLLVPVFVYTDGTLFPGLAAGAPVFGSALILMSPAAWLNRRVLSSKPFRLIGLVSYSWYLWHWPLLSFAHISTSQPFSQAAGCVIALIALVLAYGSYRFVEQPFRQSKVAAIPLLKKYAVLCVVMTVPGLAMFAMKGLPQRYPRLSAIEDASRLEQQDECLVITDSVTPILTEHCVPKSDPRDAVALLGDSHAAALGAAMREVVNAHGMKLYEITKGSCPPLLGVTRLIPATPQVAPNCARYNTNVLALLRSDPRVKTVVLTAFWSTPFRAEDLGYRYQKVDVAQPASPAESRQNLQMGLANMVAALRSAGYRVVVLDDDPDLGFDPARWLRTSMIPLRRQVARLLTPGIDGTGMVPRREVITRMDETTSALIRSAAGTSASVFDLKQNLCNRQDCLYSLSGSLLYRDPHHLSLAGARLALQGAPIGESQP